MTLSEIKTAVEAGKSVCWATKWYQVIKNNKGQWFIAWNHGQSNSNYIDLTWQDGVTMNGKEEEFFILN